MGQKKYPVSFFYLGNANYKYDDLKNFLYEIKKKKQNTLIIKVVLIIILLLEIVNILYVILKKYYLVKLKFAFI